MIEWFFKSLSTLVYLQIYKSDLDTKNFSFCELVAFRTEKSGEEPLLKYAIGISKHSFWITVGPQEIKGKFHSI